MVHTAAMYTTTLSAAMEPVCKRDSGTPLTASAVPWRSSAPAARRFHSRLAVHMQAGSTPQQQNAASLDVSGAVVQPFFRQTPWAAEAEAAADTNRAAARIAFISESGICRSVLAAAAFHTALQKRSPELAAKVECKCRATKDFCVGEGPDPLVEAVAAELGLELPAGYAVQQFKESRDIVEFDVCLVMNKFTAADVLREVSVFDTIKTWGKANYSSKVRRLGEFSPAMVGTPTSKDPEAGDIGDALYGNVGGEEELVAVRQVAAVIQQSCEGFADFLVSLEQQHAQPRQASGNGATTEADRGRLGDTLTAVVREMGSMDWLVPPMLQSR